MMDWVPKGMTLLLAATLATGGAIGGSAQKSGGTLRIYNSTNPPSASIHEEATIATVVPFAAVFSNLVMYDPTKSLNSFDTIIPELAESWSYDDSKLKLTFKLRQGVKWHDGKPFTAKDVQCTFHRLNGKEEGYFPAQSAQGLVRESHRGDGQRRPRGDVPPRTTSAILHRHARVGIYAALPLPCRREGYAHCTGRHRPVQASSASKATTASSSCVTPTTGRRDFPTSTPSIGASFRAARRGFSRSRPASSI